VNLVGHRSFDSLAAHVLRLPFVVDLQILLTR
jgi:hypothetical protein